MIDNLVANKYCPRCKQTKQSDEFIPVQSRKDGLAGYCRKCANERKMEYYYNEGRGRDAEKMRKRRQRWGKLGITAADVNELLKQQDFLCPLCKRHLTLEDFVVDHCHETNHVRGILHKVCNLGLGGFEDNIEFLQNAIEYLRKTQ